MNQSLDKINAPQYVDFEKLGDDMDIDKYFDIDHEAENARHSSRRDTFEVLVPTTPQVLQQMCAENGVEEDKENCTPKSSARKRRHSQSAQKDRNQTVLGDISTYLTPGTSRKKSQVFYMENGRSLLMQTYEGIALMTPNKTHPMETRLDVVIKSPGLSLRTRSVTRELEKQAADVELPRRSKRFNLKEEHIEEMEPEEIPEAAANNDDEELNAAAAVPPKPEQETQAAKKAVRVGYRAPMIAVHPASVENKSYRNAQPAKPKKFMAAAEVVHHFLKDTPERFHSRPARATNKLQICKSNSGPKPNTIPKSPFLVTKSRLHNRFAEHIPTQAEREQQELEEIKKHPIKANPLHRSILLPMPRKYVFNSKTPTKPEPFKLSQGKRKEPTPDPVFRFKAQAVPHGILNSPKGVPARQELPLTEPQSPNLRVTAKYPKRIKVETPGNQEKEVGHFGLENKRATPSRITKVQPFSFEERDRQMLQHKKEFIEKAMKEEEEARKFKATRKPVFSSPALPQRKIILPTKAHTPQLSAFRHGLANQQKFKQQMAQEKAQQQQAATFRAKPATVTHKKPFEPVLPHRILPYNGDLTLNTMRRASERAQFDDMLRRKEEEIAAQKAEQEALLEAEAREEEARLRREAEFKATGIRLSSPMKTEPSRKPLTEPVSPKFMLKERASRSMRQAE